MYRKLQTSKNFLFLIALLNKNNIKKTKFNYILKLNEISHNLIFNIKKKKIIITIKIILLTIVKMRRILLQ